MVCGSGTFLFQTAFKYRTLKMTEELILSLVSFHAAGSPVNRWGLARFIYENTVTPILGLKDLTDEDYCRFLGRYRHLTPFAELEYTYNSTNSTKHLKSRVPGRGLNVEKFSGKITRGQLLLKMVRGITLKNVEIMSLRQYIDISFSETALFTHEEVQLHFNDWERLSSRQKLAFLQEDPNYGTNVVRVKPEED